MEYEKTNWTNNVTPLNAENMNKIENCLAALVAAVNNLADRVTVLENQNQDQGE